MTGSGQSRRFQPPPVASDLPLTTDIAIPARLLRLVPRADIVNTWR